MKTTSRTSRSLPSPFKVSIYLIAVAVFCFINWTVLRAGDPAGNEINSLESRLTAALVPVDEPGPVLEDWMLSFSSEIVLEDWMVDRLEFSGAEEIEAEPAVEEWMVNAANWASPEFLANK